jgi:hypothetical protein
MPPITISSGTEIPEAFGPIRTATRKTTVAVRHPSTEETFIKPWGTLTARPGIDVVAIEDGGDEHPVKIDLFARTYTEVAPGRYRKSAVTRVVQIPPSVVVELETLEGREIVEHPDYIAIGISNEVYANSFHWVAANLQFAEPPSAA